MVWRSIGLAEVQRVRVAILQKVDELTVENEDVQISCHDQSSIEKENVVNKCPCELVTCMSESIDTIVQPIDIGLDGRIRPEADFAISSI